VRDRLRNAGVSDKVGGVNRFTSVADAVAEWAAASEAARASGPPASQPTP
jgi:hypothetical protein